MIEDNNIDFLPEEKNSRTIIKPVMGTLGTLLIFLTIGIGYCYYLNTPEDFANTITVTIEEGDSVPLITQKLESAGVVKSSNWLYFILATVFDPTQIKASRYVFESPLSSYQVAEQLITGDFDTDLIAITVFEGESREKISARLNNIVPWFDSTLFMTLTTDLEGKLFPDTYFIPQEYTTEQFVELLHATYVEVLGGYESAFQSQTLSTTEIVTLASIVEREANTTESMKLVAGIFLNRLDIGMPLQADATIEYILEHDLNEFNPGELALSLREIDSPYNTYLYSELPPTPIGNPGRDAIEAVLLPTESNYLYYLTGDDGKFYYAETYNQHLNNIDSHLK